MLGTQLPAPNLGSQPIDLGGTGPPLSSSAAAQTGLRSFFKLLLDLRQPFCGSQPPSQLLCGCVGLARWARQVGRSLPRPPQGSCQRSVLPCAAQFVLMQAPLGLLGGCTATRSIRDCASEVPCFAAQRAGDRSHCPLEPARALEMRAGKQVSAPKVCISLPGPHTSRAAAAGRCRGALTA